LPSNSLDYVGELRAAFPNFFWNAVYPYIQEGLDYLRETQQGKQIVANLYANVFVVERELQERASTAVVRRTSPEMKKLVLQTAASREMDDCLPVVGVAARN